MVVVKKNIRDEKKMRKVSKLKQRSEQSPWRPDFCLLLVFVHRVVAWLARPFWLLLRVSSSWLFLCFFKRCAYREFLSYLLILFFLSLYLLLFGGFYLSNHWKRLSEIFGINDFYSTSNGTCVEAFVSPGVMAWIRSYFETIMTKRVPVIIIISARSL